MSRPTFSDGQRVRCINDAGGRELRRGATYEVDSTVIDEDGEWVSVYGATGEWSPSRFEAIS